CDPSVIKANGKYHLYYTAAGIADNGVRNNIFLATSSESLSGFVKHGGNNNPQPVLLVSDPDTNCYGTGQGSVFFKDNVFHHYYTDTVRGGMMYATSTNGTQWIGQNNRIPVIRNVHSVVVTYLRDKCMYLGLRGDGETQNNGTQVWLSADGYTWSKRPQN